jgi:O-antigen ligase
MPLGTRLRIGEGLEARRAPLPLEIAVFVVFAGVVVMRPGLPSKFSFVDPVIFAVAAYSVVSMLYRGSPATSGALRLLPWIWLILLGSFLGLSAVGIPYWAMSNLARTMFALLTFVCFWHVISLARLQRAAIYGTAAGVAVTTLSLLSQAASYRAAAFFLHPNYAGHYMALATMVLFVVAKRWYLKALAAFALLVALQQTSSFGAIAMVVSMLAVYAVRVLSRNTAILAAALAVLAIGGLFLATPQAQDLVSNEDTDWTFSDSLSGDRFERSGDTRLILWSQAIEAWAEEPLGIGPDGVRSRGVAVWRGHVLEIHSDSLGYVVERGIVGLIGFIGLWVVLFRLAPKGGLGRVLIVAMFVAGFFRETMHYRHMWLLLALAFAYDYAKRSPDDADDEPPVELDDRGDRGDLVRARTVAKDPLSLADPYFPADVRRPGS